MIVNVSPSLADLDDSINALRYGSIAKDIVVRSKVDTGRPVTASKRKIYGLWCDWSSSDPSSR
jgi:hypothetical protein